VSLYRLLHDQNALSAYRINYTRMGGGKHEVLHLHAAKIGGSCCHWSLNRLALWPLSKQTDGIHAAFQPTIPCKLDGSKLRLNMNTDTWPSATGSLPPFILGLFFLKPDTVLLVNMPTLFSIVEHLYQARWYLVTLLLASYIASEVRRYRRLSHINGLWTILRALASHNRLSTKSPSCILRHQRDTVSVSTNLPQNPKKKKTDVCFPGKLARIGTNMLITCDIHLLTRINAPRSRYKRSDWYLGFQLAPGIDNVGSLRIRRSTRSDVLRWVLV